MREPGFKSADELAHAYILLSPSAEEREQAAAASLYGSAFEQVKKNGEEETDE